MTAKHFGEISSSLAGNGGSYLKVKEDESGFEFQKTEPIGDWIASYVYYVGDIVQSGLKIYRCKTQHTSTTSLLTDIAKWDELSASVAVDPITLLATTSSVGQLQQPAGTRLLHTYGTNNLFLGSTAGNFTLSGADRNIGIGTNSLLGLTGGDDNISIGFEAGKELTTGTTNSVLGNYAGRAQTTGASNTLIGYYAGGSGNGTASVGINNNTYIGYQTGYIAAAAIAGADNVAIGYQAKLGSAAASTICIGSGAGQGIFGAGSIAIGYQTLDGTASGAARNTVIGYQAGTNVTTGSSNVSIGYESGITLSYGGNNCYVGYQAGTNSSYTTGGGSYNIGIGTAACQPLTGAAAPSNNIGIGHNALMSTDTGCCVAVGYSAGSGIFGLGSIAIGYQTLDGTSSGADNNVAIGYTSGTAVTTGTDNTFLGDLSGDSITTGSKNTFLGSGTDGSAVSRTGATAVGYGAAPAANYVAVFGAAAGAGNAAGELNGIGVGTQSPTAYFSAYEKIAFSKEGGLMVKLTNKTGSASVKGYVVEASDTDNNAVQLSPVNDVDPFGVFYESGVADGSEAWIVVSGRAQVYFGTSTTRGNFARVPVTGDTGAASGVAYNEAAPSPPLSTDKHFMEIGHVIESIGAAGLAYCILHFN